MRGGTRLRRAVKQHQCTERTYHTIRPGEIYLSSDMPPGHEFNRGKKWVIIKACLRCANEFGMLTHQNRIELQEKVP